MSIVLTAAVSCDGEGCIEWYDGGGTKYARDARAAAARAGWRRWIVNGKRKDYCPECSANAEQER